MKGSNRNNVALTIAGAKRSSSGVKCYQELGLQSLKQWRWCGKLCFFFKMIKKTNSQVSLQFNTNCQASSLQGIESNIPHYNVKRITLKILSSFQLYWNNWKFGAFQEICIGCQETFANSIFYCHNFNPLTTCVLFSIMGNIGR